MRAEIGPRDLRRIVAGGLVHRLEPGAPVGIAVARVVDRVEPRARRKPPRLEVRIVRVVRTAVHRGCLLFAVLVCGFFGCGGSATRSIETSRPLRKR